MEYRGICIDPTNQLILVSEKHLEVKPNYLKSFTLDGQTIKGIPLVDDAETICVYESKIFISCLKKRTILVLDSNYRYHSTITIGRYTSPSFYFSSFCIQGSGHIVIGAFGQSILIVDSSGNTIKEFGHYGGGDGQFRGVGKICCNSRDEIIVTDILNHRIQIFDRSGNFIFAFGSEGVLPDQFRGLGGICVDQNDNILVADYVNDRISIFSPKGDLLQTIDCPIKGGCLQGLTVWNRKIVTSRYNSICIFSN